MIGIIGQISATLSAIEAQKAADVEEALRMAVCPWCGRRVDAVRHQGFMVPEVGLSERLVGRCPVDHEWAVREPTFRWEGQQQEGEPR